MTGHAVPAVCSIGSTDPWNAAGLGLDIRALADCGVRAVSVVAGVTAQDRRGLRAVHAIPARIIAEQLAVLREADVRAYRVGALPDVASVELVASYLAEVDVPVVVDPVLAASAGGTFGSRETVDRLRTLLLPQATVVTPNLSEAAVLAGAGDVSDPDGMERAGLALRALGSGAALVKGGHLPGATVDVLVAAEGTVLFEAPRLAGTLRGTGCLLGCALAAELARGRELRPAVEYARAFVRSKFASSHAAGGMTLAY